MAKKKLEGSEKKPRPKLKLVEEGAETEIVMLRADMKEAVKELLANSSHEAAIRYLVEQYYDIQGNRIRAGQRSIKLAERCIPNYMMTWVSVKDALIETYIRSFLNEYTLTEPVGMGNIAQSVYGIGPVISAGMMAYVQMDHTPSVSSLWSFAGLNPKAKWISREQAQKYVDEAISKGVKEITPEHIARLSTLTEISVERLMKFGVDTDKGRITKDKLQKFICKRPWNDRFKVLCWKISSSFKMRWKKPECYYGHLYSQFKAVYTQKNESGGFTERTKLILSGAEGRKWNRDNLTRRAYESGILSDGHIDAMACRKTAKIFLSHWWEAAYIIHYKKEPPLPYAIAHLGHKDIIFNPMRKLAEDKAGI